VPTAYQWGFAPSRRTRPADAIRRVALEGDPNRRNANVSLTRPNTRPNPRLESRPETKSEIQPETQANTPPTIITLWDYAGIDVPQPPSQLDLAKVDG